MELDLKVIDKPANILLLSITGRIKSGDIKPLENEFRRICKGPPVKLILNVQAVEAIDSSGIGELIRARTEILGKGGRVVLLGVNNRVEMMVKLSGLDNYFPIAPTESEAIQVLNQPPAEPPKEEPAEPPAE
jgi:anti-anti-sigma factor